MALHYWSDSAQSLVPFPVPGVGWGIPSNQKLHTWLSQNTSQKIARRSTTRCFCIAQELYNKLYNKPSYNKLEWEKNLKKNICTAESLLYARN